MLTIPYRYLAVSAYAYMVIPITFFFYGWLNVPAFLWATGCLWAGFYFLYKREYQAETSTLVISKKALLLAGFVICLWVIESGIGGITYQHWDLHWRNAIFRDLVNFSWPVVYPETDHALVYYFPYWLVPAAVGKLFGWTAARAALMIWAVIGLGLCYLLTVHLLKEKLGVPLLSNRQLLVISLVLIGWGGADYFGGMIVQLIGRFNMGFWSSFGWPDHIGGYQYTPIFPEVAWVYNQCIVPWVAVPLLLYKYHRLSIYAFLGLCVLPFSPIPFCGLFLMMCGLGFYELYAAHFEKWNDQLKDIFSPENVLAAVSIFPVFLLFFTMNANLEGQTGVSGFGIYMPLVDDFPNAFPGLLLFLAIEVGVYTALIGKEYRKSFLFWFTVASLCIIPVFRVGLGRDFCMRASIPAFFTLMLFVSYWFLKHFQTNSVRGLMLFAVFVTTFLSSCVLDAGFSLGQVKNNHWHAIWADDMYTFADKFVRRDKNANYMNVFNFITDQPMETRFFRTIGHVPTESEQARDLERSQSLRLQRQIYLVGGKYVVRPDADAVRRVLTYDDDMVVLGADKGTPIRIDTLRDAYHFVFDGAADVKSDTRKVLDLPQNNAHEGASLQLYRQLDNAGQVGPAQAWKLRPIDDGYAILHDDWAVTYDLATGRVFLSKFTGAANQKWIFEPVD